MRKAGLKTTVRLFKKHIARLCTIIAIVLVSIGFMSGIGEVEGTIKLAATEHYAQQNVSDLYLKSKDAYGFTPDERAKIIERFGEEHTEFSLCYEYKQDERIFRVYSYDLQNSKINELEVLKGKLPTGANEIAAERETPYYKGYALGDKITVQGAEYVVCGIVENPLLLLNKEERSFQYDGEFLGAALYIQTDTLPMVNDVHITLDDGDRYAFNGFSRQYEEKIDEIKGEVLSILGEERVSVLSLYENAGLFSLVSYAEKVGLIGIVFVVFFLLVTLLVVYSTTSRLFDEERAQIACQKTLGYSDGQIVGRYVLFVLFGVAVGGVLALPVGYGLMRAIYSAFNSHYAMPACPSGVRFFYYLFTFAIIFLCNAVLAIISGLKTAKGKPAELLTPKAPKAGKKVLLEKIPFIWNRLSFKYKSTVRNVLLFKSRFLMTVVSVVGSTVLVFAGMGLLDCARLREDAFSIVVISIVLLIFSAVLCALVVYNLTNINVSERKREIATLMVLGYHDLEVTGYVYREIYIMSAIGAVLGVPLGIAFIEFVFGLINFGSLADINWWSYLLTPVITMIFSFISTKLLRKKIVKTDMNASLKTVE